LKEQLELLIKLQMYDSVLFRAQMIQEEHPQKIKQLEEALEQERKELQSKEKQLEEIKKKRIGKEQDLAIEEEKVRKAKERLTAVKTNKEYQAALKEIEAIEKQNSRLEEEVLIFMEQSDNILKNLKKMEEHFKLTMKKTEEKKIELENTLEKCTEEIEEQQKVKEELLSKIESKLLDQYQKIKQKRADPIIVPVEDSCCQGCHMNIPPQLFNEIKKCQTIIKCPHCNRILYWEKNHEATSLTL
jgi:predicted  nucleic acid-binding Zn-ribbon protein